MRTTIRLQSKEIGGKGDPDSAAKQVTESGNHIITALNQAPAELLTSAGLESAFRDLATPPSHAVAPAPPSAVAAFATPTDAYITWRPPVFDGGMPVDHYTIHSDDGLQTTISEAEFDRLSYARLHLTASTKARQFAVTASNSVGTSAESLPSLPIHAATQPLALPGPPQSVSVRIDGSRASIHFAAPKEPGTGVLAYVITIDPDDRKQTFTGRRLITLEGAHVTFVSLDGLTPGKYYRFGVAAVNPSGEGEQTWAEDKREP